MKKIAALLLAILLVMAALPALAVDAQYATTQKYMDYLDANGYKYTYLGVNSDTQNEQVRISYNADNRESVRVNCVFNPDLNRCVLYSWDVIEYDAAMQDLVKVALDSLNGKYYFAKFYTDSSDNTVTAEGYVRLDPDGDYSAIIDRMVDMMASIVDEATLALAPYSK